jgi:hypothetical protein
LRHILVSDKIRNFNEINRLAFKSDRLLERDPEKWQPVFRKDRAPLRIKGPAAMPGLFAVLATAERRDLPAKIHRLVIN